MRAGCNTDRGNKISIYTRNIVKWSVCFLLLLIQVQNGFAQKKLDSAIAAAEAMPDDTNKVIKLDKIIYGDILSKGDYARVDTLALQGLKIAEKINYKKGIAGAYNLLGISYRLEGNYPKALEAFLNSLKLITELGNQANMAVLYNNIGSIYYIQKDFDKALKYFEDALKINVDAGAKRTISNTRNNIGLIYTSENKRRMALDEFFKSLATLKELGDTSDEANTLNNIGLVYHDSGDYKSALYYINQALVIAKHDEDKNAISDMENNIAIIYTKEKDYKNALDYAQKSLAIAKEIQALDEVSATEKTLSDIYSELGDGANALKHYKEYITFRDSIFNQENTKKTVRAEMNFDFEKKQAAIKADQDKKDALQQEQARKQELIIYFISGILLIVFAFAIFAYRSYLQKQKANSELDSRNNEIEKAYHIIEEKNREITDSINYAKRIQSAMLPSVEVIQKFVPQSFILFKPKDIVSGDFYFFTRNGKQSEFIYLAAADCTGHGVPGAFMSMIGSEKLHDAVQQSTNTGQVLEKLNKGIKTSLHQSTYTNSSRDGMDIALVAIKASLPSIGGYSGVNQITPLGDGGAALQFSSANRPMWIIRKDAAAIEEVKPTKKAIGGFTEEDATFDTQEIKLNAGDTFYIFSDGYADQFGGSEGKKLTTKKLRELLLSLQHLSMPHQQKELDKFITDWKGEKEQLDDILMIGVRA